jgi:superfamily II DNA or RNA helicase
MESITLKKKDHVHYQVITSRSIQMELGDHFSFYADGFKHMPAYKNGTWDGKIRLFNIKTREIFVGLLHHVLAFAKSRDYEVILNDSIKNDVSVDDSIDNNVTTDQIIDFASSLLISSRGNNISLRDYQADAIVHGINSKRAVLISPTGCLSGNTKIQAKVKDALIDRPMSYTMKEIYDMYQNNVNISIHTQYGYKNIIGAYTKEGPGRIINYNDGSNTVGHVNHKILIKNNFHTEKFTNLVDIKIGDIAYSPVGSDKMVIGNNECPYSKWYDFSVNHESESYIQNGILHHNSGKSLIIYILMRWFIAKYSNFKILVIVPSTALVEQMYNDFADYSNKDDSFDVESNVIKIYSGYEKINNSTIVCSTWQSIFKLPNDWFSSFSCVIVDECHQAKANSIQTIMGKLINTPYRIGLSGSLDGSKVNSLLLEGVFGEIKKVTQTKTLIDRGELSKLNINVLMLNHSSENKINNKDKNKEYQKELEWIVTNNKRNNFIAKLALDLNGNTLILFQYIEKQGEILKTKIEELKDENRKLFYIIGESKTKEREKSRGLIEQEKDAIILANYQIFSQGINIRNIHNIIFASPSKSQVRVLQSIGRGLRKSDDGRATTLYDIADDLSYGKYKNHTLRHYMERVEIYINEKFPFKVFEMRNF